MHPQKVIPVVVLLAVSTALLPPRDGYAQPSVRQGEEEAPGKPDEEGPRQATQEATASDQEGARQSPEEPPPKKSQQRPDKQPKEPAPSYSGWTLLSHCHPGDVGGGLAPTICYDGSASGIVVGTLGVANLTRSVYGIQLAAINIDVGLPGTVVGFRLGAVNVGDFDALYGVQVGGFDIDARGELCGVKVNAFDFSQGTLNGLKLGFVGSSHLMRGAQIDAIHLLDGLDGVGVGVFGSWVERVRALQIGLVSRATDLTGMQAGFINLVQGESGWVSSYVEGNVDYGYYSEDAHVTSRNAVRGVQIGVVNYTRHLVGVQLGLINIATENFLPFFPGILVGWRQDD